MTDRDAMELKDRAVVITGAGRGLGRAYAHHAARLGGRIVVNDVDADVAQTVAAEIVAEGGTAVAMPASVADWEHAGALIAGCVERFGAIDGLVNNAAIVLTGPAWDAEEQQLRTIVEVNLLGTMYCGVHALRAMREQEGGTIVNVTSGAHLGLPELAAYGATKGATASLTYAWALEGASCGVRVNAVSPTANTRMTGDWEFKDQTPQPLEPGEIAPVVSFLLSERAAGLNGQVVRLDGRKLSLLRKSGYGKPLEREAWSVETIADAFASGQLGELAPLGMHHPAVGSRAEPRERLNRPTR